MIGYAGCDDCGEIFELSELNKMLVPPCYGGRATLGRMVTAKVCAACKAARETKKKTRKVAK